MNIEYIDSENYELVLAFLKKENESISEWESLLKEGLFKICVSNQNDEIESIFIFDDYPNSLQNKYSFIPKSNWENWLKNYFEVPNETYHTLWIAKFYITESKRYDVDLLRLVLSSIFISNFEIKSILLSLDTPTKSDNAEKNEESEKTGNSPFSVLFNPLHRVKRTTNDTNNTDQSLLGKIDLFYCLSSKILPNIQVRKATVEDFDDLMPLFQENSHYLQQKHGEFFLAELIESAQNDNRLQTLVAISNSKPVGFVSFSTNVDLMSLRNSFYLEQFDDFQKIEFPRQSENNNDETNGEKVIEYKMDIPDRMDKIKTPSALMIDTSLSALQLSTSRSDTPNKNDTMVVAINLLCIDSNYIYATKVFAKSIFNYYPKCRYLLSTTFPDEPTPNHINYFSRVYPKPCVEYPYNLYLLDKNAISAVITIRLIDWKSDYPQLKQIINSTVPNRERYLSNINNTHCYAIVVDHKIIGVVYISNITMKEISEFSLMYDISAAISESNNLNTTNTAKLEFMILNPIFNINVKGILKEIMRKININTLFYYYIPEYAQNSKDYVLPDPQSSLIENFIYGAQMQTTYALYTFDRRFYAESQEILNHRIVIVGNNDDCVYGLIEYLIVQKDLKFTNITLINTLRSKKPKFAQDLNDIKTNTLLFKSNIISNGNYLQKLCVDNKVEIINDNISQLDVNKKCIHLKDSGVCVYDILVFANGLGPVHIIPQMKYLTNNNNKPKKTNIEFNQLLKETMEYKNVLLISPEIENDIQHLDMYIQNNTKLNVLNNDENIVIYGDSINMFCIINHLITKHNIKGNKIILIKCLSSTSSQLYFKNSKLKAMIEKQLKDLGVTILKENITPVGFIENKFNPCLVDGIQFISNDKEQENEAAILCPKFEFIEDTQSELSHYLLSSQLVILCQNEIDIDTLNIINQNPFVIDGQIVIDNKFQTQDSTIYAIGSMAKLSRKYISKDLSSLQYTNSFDIGTQSAHIIVDNILNGERGINKDNKEFKINMEKPTCIVAKLPGSYNYFYAYNPEFVMNNKSETKYFESYNDNENEISFVCFDSFGYLREILYYGIEWKQEWIQCACLVNTHSAFLSNMENYFNRDEESKFVNICQLLNKPEYHIMYDDRFKDWMQTVNNSKNTDKDQVKNDIESLIKRIANNNTNA